MISVKKLLYRMISEMTIKEITTDSFSSLPYTFSNAELKAHHTIVEAQLSNPLAQTGDWTVTFANGSLTVNGTIDGATTLKLKLAKGDGTASTLPIAVKENNNAQATGNTAVTLATSDKNITLSTLTGNGVAHLTSNGALAIDKAGKYLLIGDWGFNGLTSGNVLTVSIRKWDGSATSSLDSWGISVGGAYFSKTCAKIVDLSVGDAIFMSARNNSGATGSFNFARLIAIKLD